MVQCLMSQSITKASVPPPTVPTFAPLVEGPAVASEAEAARCLTVRVTGSPEVVLAVTEGGGE
jgi:hypothetical protein